jgi:L-methionine (R)-S-oxide reductase
MAVDYQSLNNQLAALLADEQDALANSASFVGLLYAAIPDINWLGIYVLRGQELVLGPFQGLPACVRIPLGRGVCGTAAARIETLCVDNVHEFAGHIVCDPESRSEVVVPLSIHTRLVGVLDIDSPKPSRFSEADQRGVELLCRTFVQILEKNLPDTGEFI